MKRTLFILSIVTVLLSGCYEDKGNYDYVDVNTVTIDVPESVTITLIDELTLDPKLTYSNPEDTEGFTFEWRENTNTISNERKLVYRPTKTGPTRLELYVRDRNGIGYRTVTSVTVNSPYKWGYAILADKGNASTLHFVGRNNDTGEFIPYPDQYNKLFPGAPLGTGPKKLSMTVIGSMDELIIFQDNEDLALHGFTLEKELSLREEFPSLSYPGGAKMIDGDYTLGLDVLLDDQGRIYTRPIDVGNILHYSYFIAEPKRFEKPGTFISQLIRSKAYACMSWMYDSGNNRLVALYSNSHPATGDSFRYGAELVISDEGNPEEFTSLNDLGEYRFVYSNFRMPYIGTLLCDYRNILKHSDGTYAVQSYRATRNATEVKLSNQIQQPFIGTGIVTDNTLYEMRSDGQYMFFAEGSKLYMVEFRTSGDTEIQYLTLLNDFGKRITVLQRGDNYTSAVNGHSIGIAVEGGTFYVLRTIDQMLISNDPWKEGKVLEMGNLGEVVDVIWKYGSTNSWFQDYSF